MKYIRHYSFDKIQDIVVREVEVNKNSYILNFYLNSNKIGYIEYQFDGSAFSEFLSDNESEVYMSMIEVYSKYRKNNYSTFMLDTLKSKAKKLGATIITLRIDYGGGYGERNPNRSLDKIYLSNGFKYSFTEEECIEDDVKSLGAMYYRVKY